MLIASRAMKRQYKCIQKPLNILKTVLYYTTTERYVILSKCVCIYMFFFVIIIYQIPVRYRLRNSKRAIIDADYVINKLDEKNLRSWLYRAAAYLRLGDEKNYDTSIKFAKKNNTKEISYITAFQEKLRTDF